MQRERETTQSTTRATGHSLDESDKPTDLRTVVTFGTFDLFHIGHLRLLERAANLGDRLVVGVSTDDFNFRKKGKYPFVPEQDRMAILEALSCVDEVFAEESLELKAHYLREQAADVLVMGNDWEGRFDHLRAVCDVIYLSRTDNVSTTEIERIVGSRGHATHQIRSSAVRGA